MVSEGGKDSCSMHIINPKKYLTIQICKSADRRSSFFCECLQTAECLRITACFTQTFLTAASLRTVVRCFVNLDELDYLAVST